MILLLLLTVVSVVPRHPFPTSSLQDGKNLFPAPQPNNVPVSAPPKPKSVKDMEKEKASQISPFRATLTTASAYTGGRFLVYGDGIEFNA